jgi:hypothetical protein
MKFSYIALPLALAYGTLSSILMRNDCNANNCARAITGTNAKPSATIRQSDCSSYQQTTVTPAPSTTTVYTTVLPSNTYVPFSFPWPIAYFHLLTTNSTITEVYSCATFSPSIHSHFPTSAPTSLPNVVCSVKSTITASHGGSSVTVSKTSAGSSITKAPTSTPKSVPTYASACTVSGTIDDYASACSCWGITKKTTTAHAPVTTKTLTVSATTAVTVTITSTQT